mgnify:CR=1 FL=1
MRSFTHKNISKAQASPVLQKNSMELLAKYIPAGIFHDVLIMGENSCQKYIELINNILKDKRSKIDGRFWYIFVCF